MFVHSKFLKCLTTEVNGNLNKLSDLVPCFTETWAKALKSSHFTLRFLNGEQYDITCDTLYFLNMTYCSFCSPLEYRE